MLRYCFPLILFSLIILFQNCSRIAIDDQANLTKEISVPTLAESGNGSGYGGKLTSFYNYIPGYQCENKNSAYAKVDFAPLDTESTLSVSKDSKCLSMTSVIPNNQFDTGLLQNKVIGFEEQIFEYHPEGEYSIPEKPVEIWCVDQWGKSSIEILSLYNSSLNQAETQFYYPGTPIKVEINPARSTSQQTVRLTSNYFDLVINKTLLGNKAGTFQGQLTKLNQNNEVQVLQCRLGGYLDAHLWPAKALNFDNLKQFNWNPLEKAFYVVTGNPLGNFSENIFSSYSASGDTKQVLVANSLNAHGVENFKFSPDHSKVTLQAQLSGDSAIQLYLYDFQSQLPPKRINSSLQDFGQAVTGDVTISPNGDSIYYLDGSQETGNDVEPWLRAVSVATGEIFQINQDLPKGADESVGQYDVSFPLAKVVYSTGFLHQDIWFADLMGSNRRKLDLSTALGSKYHLELNMKTALHWKLMNNRYLILVATIKDYSLVTTISSLVLVVDLATETLVFKEELPGRRSLHPIKSLPLVALFDENNNVLFLDPEGKKVYNTTQIINLKKSATDPSSQKFVSTLNILSANDICSNNESLLSQMQVSSDLFLLIKKGSGTASSLYLASNKGNSCTLINKIVLGDQVIADFKKMPLISKLYDLLEDQSFHRAAISPDQNNIIASIGSKLYLIPTNKSPIVEVYTPSNSGPIFSEFDFVDSQTIYFTGNLIKNNSSQLFIWTLPKK